MNSLSQDTFFSDRIRVKQKRFGYRFSIDAIIIAFYASKIKCKTILDLGTGCGIIPLVLADRNPDINIFGIEFQKDLAQIASINVDDNKMKKRINIIHNDIKHLKPDMLFCPVDLVVTNPPYIKFDAGRINPDIEKAIARHEIKITLADILETAYRMLQVSGKFLIIYPSQRLADLLVQMRKFSIEPKFLQMIHSYPDSKAQLVLIEGTKKGRPGMEIAPSLILHEKNGSYSKQIREMFYA